MTACKYCDQDATHRGMCNMHYGRWKRTGDPKHRHQGGQPRRGPSLEQVLERLRRGETVGAIAAEFEVHRETIQRTLRVAKIRARDVRPDSQIALSL